LQIFILCIIGIDPALSIYGLNFIVYYGDHLKKIVLLMAALCCTLLCSGALAAEKADPPKFDLLKADSGKNLSQMNFSLYSVTDTFGQDGIGIGEAAKFTAPGPNWKLMALQFLGWSGFNETTQKLPIDRNFLVEIRDKDLNLLYKFADAQNLYFGSAKGPVITGMEIPALPVTGDFYVIFYDRGSMGLGMESAADNETGKSFFFMNGQLAPAEFVNKKTNETIDFNWVIRAIGA
jgi:hypothetical protein